MVEKVSPQSCESTCLSGTRHWRFAILSLIKFQATSGIQAAVRLIAGVAQSAGAALKKSVARFRSVDVRENKGQGGQRALQRFSATDAGAQVRRIMLQVW